MAFQTQELYEGDGNTTNYTFPFEYIKEADIKVSLNGADTTEFTFANATTIQFNTAPADGAAIRIYRVTDIDNAVATFFSGSSIRAQDLNDNADQLLYSTQETVDRRLDRTGGTMTGDINMSGNDIIGLPTGAPADNTGATSKAYVNSLVWNNEQNPNRVDVAFTGTTDIDNLVVHQSASFTTNVDITANGFLKIPVGTNAQQPGQTDQPAAAVGQIRFNTDISQFEGYHGAVTQWASIGGGATGGGGDTVFVETSQLITTDYTLTTGPTQAEKKNAMSAGPITINSGVTVTVPAGQSWVIV